jgi:selenium metabolism protein YedF
MKKLIDARGLPCPKPVIKTRECLEQNNTGIIEVIVDNPPAKDNVIRYAKNSGALISEIVENDGIYHIIIENKVDETVGNAEAKKIMSSRSVTDSVSSSADRLFDICGRILFIDSDRIGKDNEELGEKLMQAFIYTLTELQQKPEMIILMNSGVKLSIKGSATAGNLEKLEKTGIRIFVCGTCLDYLSLTDSPKVGSTSNMYEIAENLLNNKSVLKI